MNSNEKTGKKPNLQIGSLTPNDVARLTDRFVDMRSLILANEPMYPEIKKWFEDKVVSGVKNSQRHAYIGYYEQKPVVSAVLKKGAQSKICHLRIADAIQEDGLGELFFSLMAMEIRHEAEEIHFTLPESLWQSRKGFFQSFGFCDATLADTQYRLFENELKCSAPFHKVWQAVLGKLPRLINRFAVGGFGMDSSILLSIQPRYATRILNGTKTVEVRKKFSKKWEGQRASIYASSPLQALVGEVTISQVVVGMPNEIWAAFGYGTGCTKNEFFAYASSCESVAALILEDVRPFNHEIYLHQAEYLLQEKLHPPQSYCALTPDSSWAHAIFLAAMLHGGSIQHSSRQRQVTTAKQKNSVLIKMGHKTKAIIAEQGQRFRQTELFKVYA